MSYYPGGLERWREAGLALEPGTSPTPRGPRPAAAARRRAASALLDLVERTSTAGLFLLWLLLIAACGVVFWLLGHVPGHGLLAGGTPVGTTFSGLVTALYFSFVTATSVGFGDVVPVGLARVLAVAEAAAELLVFGAIISKFVSRRQDALVAEIHRLTHEDRLSRVLANLHFSLSEFQAIAGLCSSGGAPAARLSFRVSGATLVFAGELRTVHALLYRPDAEPDEEVLESILAALSGSLGALGELLDCAEGKVERPASLDEGLARIAARSREICGECVPRDYAPHLRTWMDEIQARARRVDPETRRGASRPRG
ncbi:MAG: potassium channel family protein [Thermoanaerobaculia bacterium]